MNKSKDNLHYLKRSNIEYLKKLKSLDKDNLYELEFKILKRDLALFNILRNSIKSIKFDTAVGSENVIVPTLEIVNYIKYNYGEEWIDDVYEKDPYNYIRDYLVEHCL